MAFAVITKYFDACLDCRDTFQLQHIDLCLTYIDTDQSTHLFIPVDYAAPLINIRFTADVQLTKKVSWGTL